MLWRNTAGSPQQSTAIGPALPGTRLAGAAAGSPDQRVVLAGLQPEEARQDGDDQELHNVLGGHGLRGVGGWGGVGECLKAGGLRQRLRS